jgi:hypothetical protein
MKPRRNHHRGLLSNVIGAFLLLVAVVTIYSACVVLSSTANESTGVAVFEEVDVILADSLVLPGNNTDNTGSTTSFARNKSQNMSIDTYQYGDDAKNQFIRFEICVLSWQSLLTVACAAAGCTALVLVLLPRRMCT